MKLFFVILILCFYTACSKDYEDCSTTFANRIERINSINGLTSIWHSLDSNIPILEADTTPHDYSRDFFISDFRQMEFVSKDYAQLAEIQIQEAKPFLLAKDQHYEKVYARKKIPKPLKKKLSIDSLIVILGQTEKYKLTPRGCEGLKVKNGFLMDYKYARLIGVTNEAGQIEVLSINNFKHETRDFIQRLESLMKNQDYLFVSYIDEIILQPEEIGNYQGNY